MVNVVLNDQGRPAEMLGVREFQPLTWCESRPPLAILIPVPGHSKQFACYHDITLRFRRKEGNVDLLTEEYRGPH